MLVSTVEQKLNSAAENYQGRTEAQQQQGLKQTHPSFVLGSRSNRHEFSSHMHGLAQCVIADRLPENALVVFNTSVYESLYGEIRINHMRAARMSEFFD